MNEVNKTVRKCDGQSIIDIFRGGGFVGCIGNFRVDNKLVDWHAESAENIWDDDNGVFNHSCSLLMHITYAHNNNMYVSG